MWSMHAAEYYSAIKRKEATLQEGQDTCYTADVPQNRGAKAKKPATDGLMLCESMNVKTQKR